MSNPFFEMMAGMEAASKGATLARGDGRPQNFVFNGFDSMATHARAILAMKLGDKVYVSTLGGKIPGIFAGWDNNMRANVFHLDNEKNMGCMGVPSSCLEPAND